jgi:hypothetical protein
MKVSGGSVFLWTQWSGKRIELVGMARSNSPFSARADIGASALFYSRTVKLPGNHRDFRVQRQKLRPLLGEYNRKEIGFTKLLFRHSRFFCLWAIDKAPTKLVGALVIIVDLKSNHPKSNDELLRAATGLRYVLRLALALRARPLPATVCCTVPSKNNFRVSVRAGARGKHGDCLAIGSVAVTRDGNAGHIGGCNRVGITDICIAGNG